LRVDEFRKMLEKYRDGDLTAEEEEEIENELEKLDIYQSLLEKEFTEIHTENDLEPNKKILKQSQNFAYMRIGLVALIITLLLLPTLNLFAMILGITP